MRALLIAARPESLRALGIRPSTGRRTLCRRPNSPWRSIRPPRSKSGFSARPAARARPGRRRPTADSLPPSPGGPHIASPAGRTWRHSNQPRESTDAQGRRSSPHPARAFPPSSSTSGGNNTIHRPRAQRRVLRQDAMQAIGCANPQASDAGDGGSSNLIGFDGPHQVPPAPPNELLRGYGPRPLPDVDRVSHTGPPFDPNSVHRAPLSGTRSPAALGH